MKVSVLMPVYNGVLYLQEAIDSILKQTYRDFELIIVDDGSSDDSAKIIRLNAEMDSRIVPLKNETNSGICVTLNKGLDAAQGEYIVRMDCDDISEPNRIEEQVAYMDAHQEIGLAGSTIRIFGEGIQPYLFDFDEDWRMCMADMIYATCMAHPAVIMRNELIKKHHLRYDDDFRGMEDYYMWWQCAKHTRIANIQKPLLNYRIHQKQVTQTKIDDKQRAKAKKFLDERLDFLQILLTEEQKVLIMRYLYSDFQFTDEELEQFIVICKKMLTDLSVNRKYLCKATQLVSAKAISQVVNSSNVKTKSPKYYYRKAYLCGCMPTMWFVKSFIHQIIGR